MKQHFTKVTNPKSCHYSLKFNLVLFFSFQDLDKECDQILQRVSIEEILEEQRTEQQAKQESERLKLQAVKERGLSIPKADTLDDFWNNFI